MNIASRFTSILTLLYTFSCHSPKQEIAESTPFADPPKWASEVIWYQIFVERFRNGDPSNDPTAEDIQGTYPGFVPEGWQVSRWTQDWYADDPYFPSLEEGKDFYGNPVTSFGQKSQLRRYGGDLRGVLDQLDYLDSLGVTAIYFNPLNDAPSLHKYDARYWRHIDRNFGPDPIGDIKMMEAEDPLDTSTWQFTSADRLFLQVIKEMHTRGIRVILDYSWNHTGHTYWAWQDILQKQEQSPFKDWYWVEQFDDPSTEENEFKYKGWLGVHDLPEIRETVFQDHREGIRAVEGNIQSQQVKDLIFAITLRWLDPNGDGDPSDGVDGYRLDVAAEVPLGFWREYRQVVRAVNPDAYLLGEVWWEAWPDKLLDPKPFLQGDIFDAPMNYRWYRAARHFFNQSPDKIPVSEFIDSLNSFRENIRDVNDFAMMNLTASHDAPRVLTSLYNKNAYKLNANPSEGNDYKINKPDADTYQTLKLLLAHQFTYIGAPHIWAGDEMGMWGGDDPSCRKPLIWPDLEFDPEIAHPLGFQRPRDEVRFDTDLFAYFRKLIGIRKKNTVFSNGDIDFFLIDDENDILGYRRYKDANEAIVLFNSSSETREIVFNSISNKEFEEVLVGLTLVKNDSNYLIEIPPRSAAILIGN